MMKGRPHCWWTSEQWHQYYNDRVGGLSLRQMQRTLIAMVDAGVVEQRLMRDPNGSRRQIFHYHWLGLPPAIL